MSLPNCQWPSTECSKQQQIEELGAERDRLKANLDEAAKAHAAQYAENEALKKRLTEEQDAARRLERRMTALLDALAELELNDPLSSASFVAQVREKIAERDAAQQRAGAGKALRKAANPYYRCNGDCYGPSVADDLMFEADAIERGEVAL